MNSSKFPFSYKVIWFNYFYDDPNFKCHEDCGMGLADSYADAAKQLENYYGNDLVIIKELMLYEEAPLILLNEEVVRNYSEKKYNSKACNEHGEYPKGENK